MDPTPVVPIIDPQKVTMLAAAACGAFLAILFNRGADRLTVITTLVSAMVLSWYCGHPMWGLLHARWAWFDEQWQAPVGLVIGLLGIFIVGGVVKMAKDFQVAPWKTIGDFFVSIVQKVWPAKEGK